MPLCLPSLPARSSIFEDDQNIPRIFDFLRLLNHLAQSVWHGTSSVCDPTFSDSISNGAMASLLKVFVADGERAEPLGARFSKARLLAQLKVVL